MSDKIYEHLADVTSDFFYTCEGKNQKFSNLGGTISNPIMLSTNFSIYKKKAAGRDYELMIYFTIMTSKVPPLCKGFSLI